MIRNDAELQQTREQIERLQKIIDGLNADTTLGAAWRAILLEGPTDMKAELEKSVADYLAKSHP